MTTTIVFSALQFGDILVRTPKPEEVLCDAALVEAFNMTTKERGWAVLRVMEGHETRVQFSGSDKAEAEAALVRARGASLLIRGVLAPEDTAAFKIALRDGGKDGADRWARARFGKGIDQLVEEAGAASTRASLHRPGRVC